MFGYGDSELAAFIFHELAHQAVYAPGDSDFNEAFATVVETEGLERWLAHENRSPISASSSRQERGSAMTPTGWLQARRHLAALYRREARSGHHARSARPPSSRSLRDSLAAGGRPVSGEFNNARLVAIATYERCVPALRAELDRVGNDLPAFYAAMTTLVSDPIARAKICPSF